MPLSSKLRADYVELINEYLDRLPVTNIEEFEPISQALQHLVTPEEDYTIPEALQERITTIHELLTGPEMYVTSTEDYDEYQEILKNRINAKASEFLSLSDAQKIAYIEKQQADKAQVSQTQVMLAAHLPPAPGSDAHVLTEHDMLMQLQNAPEGGASLSGFFLLISAPPGTTILNQLITMPPTMLHILAAIATVQNDNDEDEDDAHHVHSSFSPS